MKELDAIYEELKEIFAQRAGFVPNDTCDSAVRLYALATQIQALQIQNEWTLAQSFPQTAQGIYLDYHAQARGLSRREACKAMGMLRFFASGSQTDPLEIAKGTVCMNAEKVAFITTEFSVIPAGENYADVAAEAVEAGENGNASSNTILFLSTLPVGILRCSNPQAFSGGLDVESDESLRRRILQSYRRIPNGANAAFYEQEAMAVLDVVSAKAVGRARGIGTVDVYIAARNGLPSAELLEEVYTILNQKREIAVDLRILAPTLRTISIAAEISVHEGYDVAEVREKAEDALRARFLGIALGEPVYMAELGAALHAVEGVRNYHLLAPNADILSDSTELPVLDTVSVTEIAE